ncbi:MAG: hypothetical protein H0U80_00590 [Solirubrobacterales bacterium]|nr:hypothetical protein [Solirubrobacterales bacterium]
MRESFGAVARIAERGTPNAAELVTSAQHAFVNGMGNALWVGAAVLAAAALLVGLLAPRRDGVERTTDSSAVN